MVFLNINDNNCKLSLLFKFRLSFNPDSKLYSLKYGEKKKI